MKLILTIIFAFNLINANATTIYNVIKNDTTQITENSVHYKVSDDSQYIYLNICTSDKKTMMSFFRSGLSVYFDIRGKHKKEVFISYLNNSQKKQLGSNQTYFNDSEKSFAKDLNNLIEQLPQEAEYYYFEEKQQFNKDLNTLDISLQFNYNSDSEVLDFHLKVPKQKISLKENSDFSKLSIGVFTNNLESGKIQHANKNSQGSKMGQGGKHSGSGMRASEGVGIKKDGNQSQNKPKNSKSSNTSFWFDANL
ncbi:MAG: hypothetical protein K9I95_09710 [Flavobacteriaceae bacterium]|nr:hypothetical protein [Flavobacteriaceae bacterium]